MNPERSGTPRALHLTEVEMDKFQAMEAEVLRLGKRASAAQAEQWEFRSKVEREVSVAKTEAARKVEEFHAERLAELSSTRREAERQFETARIEFARVRPDGYPPGCVVQRKRKRYGSSWRANVVGETVDFGLVEVYTKDSAASTQRGHGSFPETGMKIVRLAKKNGEPGLLFETLRVGMASGRIGTDSPWMVVMENSPEWAALPVGLKVAAALAHAEVSNG